ncbi:hypothetical protein F4802DRAFT_545864 [Xylaria palmicola]|nr:hypothetical protein F4802DRAFT_545864 [Xylaria palmicola]
MRLSLVYPVTLLLANTAFTTAIHHPRDQVETAETLGAVSNGQASATLDHSATATDQQSAKCTNLTLESCDVSTEEVDVNGGIKKGGRGGRGKGGLGGSGTSKGSGLPRASVQGMVWALSAGCLCVAVASLM